MLPQCTCDNSSLLVPPSPCTIQFYLTLTQTHTITFTRENCQEKNSEQLIFQGIWHSWTRSERSNGYKIKSLAHWDYWEWMLRKYLSVYLCWLSQYPTSILFRLSQSHTRLSENIPQIFVCSLLGNIVFIAGGFWEKVTTSTDRILTKVQLQGITF